MLNEYLIRLMIDDELNIYNNDYEYKFDEKLMLIGNIIDLVIIRIRGIY